MNKEAIFNILTEMVENMSKSGKMVSGESNLISDMGLDSVAMIELFANVEREFDFEFEFEEFEFDDIVIFDNFVDYVCTMMEKCQNDSVK